MLTWSTGSLHSKFVQFSLCLSCNLKIRIQQRKNQEVTEALFFNNYFKNFVLQSFFFQLDTLVSYPFDAERSKLCAAECWVEFLNEGPYVFAKYGHSCRTVLGFFFWLCLFVCVFFVKFCVEKLKSDLNPDFCTFL